MTYTTAHSKARSFNPLSETMDQTRILMDTCRILNPQVLALALELPHAVDVGGWGGGWRERESKSSNPPQLQGGWRVLQ